MTYGTGGQPAGWYYAEGDPPGTQRYWDGAQWQGAPQVVQSQSQLHGSAGRRFDSAGLGARFGAFLLDLVMVLVLMVLLTVAVSFGSSTLEPIPNLGLLIFVVGNSIVLQGATGQSLGKKVVGIRLGDTGTGEPIGWIKTLLRALLGIVFSLFCWLPSIVDLIFIIADNDNQRMRDKILNCNVYAGAPGGQQTRSLT